MSGVTWPDKACLRRPPWLVGAAAKAGKLGKLGKAANQLGRAGRAAENAEDVASTAKAAETVEDIGSSPRKLGDVVHKADEIPSKNRSLKGKNHPATDVPFEEKVIIHNGKKYKGVFPKFESKFDARLPKGKYKNSDYLQFKESTKQLKNSIIENPSLKNKFNESQLQDIFDEEPYIDDLTWHHNESPGKMELVDRNIHAKTGHTGGKNIWGGGSGSR